MDRLSLSERSDAEIARMLQEEEMNRTDTAEGAPEPGLGGFTGNGDSPYAAGGGKFHSVACSVGSVSGCILRY